MQRYTREETIDLVKFYPSRQKQNKSAFCVEDRKKNIKQKFFRTKEQALNYAAEISHNFSLHASGKGQKLLRHIFNCG